MIADLVRHESYDDRVAPNDHFHEGHDGVWGAGGRGGGGRRDVPKSGDPVRKGEGNKGCVEVTGTEGGGENDHCYDQLRL